MSSADCEVASLQRAAEIVWCFHVFAARARCCDPDVPANVGANIEGFVGRVNVFAWRGASGQSLPNQERNVA